MDMREMVDKVKKGEPLYGPSKLSSYIQGVAARNSRYSELFIHVLPWINIVNHDQVCLPRTDSLSGIILTSLHQHGIDTAKYYQQAERELEADRTARAGSA